MLLREEMLNQLKGGLIMAQQQSEIRYLTPPSVDVKKKNTAVSKRVVLSTLITKILNS